MKIYNWQRVLCIALMSAALLGWPGAARAGDTDLDGIDDAQETGTPATPLQFHGVTYPPCVGVPSTQALRNACLSPTSKDICIYLVTAPGGGFLAANGLLAPEVLFQFITAPNTPTTTGKVAGLGVGVHVAVVTADVLSANRGVGTLGEKAVRISSDESPNSFVFGVTDEGTPINTGNATVFPVTIKNYVVNGGGTQADWTKFIQRTFSHELSHAAALTAQYNANYGGNHYPTGSGVVMDQSVVYNSKRKTFTIYSDYASGDTPCLLQVNTANPLQCIGLPLPIF